MNNFQKIVKVFAICLAVFIIVNICMAIFSGIALFTHLGNNDNESLKEFNAVYENVDTLDIDIASSNIEIKTGNEFKVEASTKKDLICKQVDGKLKIEEKTSWFIHNTLMGDVVIYVPLGTILKEIDLDTGAGEIKLENIQAESLDLDHGAGVLKISNCNFNKTDIDGGAGEIEILGSRLNNLDLDCGVGKVKMEAYVTGNSKLSAGIGKIHLTLLGDKEDYQITADKGIGSIKIENQECSSNTTYGSGYNRIKIEGGIGSIIVDYKTSNIVNL